MRGTARHVLFEARWDHAGRLLLTTGREPGFGCRDGHAHCHLIFIVRLAHNSYERCRLRVITEPSSKIQTWCWLETS